MHQQSPKTSRWINIPVAAMSLLLIGSVGCAHVDEHWTHHWRRHSLTSSIKEAHQGKYYHCPHCGQIVPREGFYKCPRCLTASPYYGYEATCWRQFPEGWGCQPESVVNNPTFWEQGLLESNATVGELIEPPVIDEATKIDEPLQEEADDRFDQPVDSNPAPIDEVQVPAPTLDVAESAPAAPPVVAQEQAAQPEPTVAPLPVREAPGAEPDQIAAVESAIADVPEVTTAEPATTAVPSDDRTVRTAPIVNPPAPVADAPPPTPKTIAPLIEPVLVDHAAPDTAPLASVDRTEETKHNRRQSPTATNDAPTATNDERVATNDERVATGDERVATGDDLPKIHLPAPILLAVPAETHESVNDAVDRSNDLVRKGLEQRAEDVAVRPFDGQGPIPVRRIELSLDETSLQPIAPPVGHSSVRPEPAAKVPAKVKASVPEHAPFPVKRIAPPVAAQGVQAPVVPAGNQENWPMPVNRIPVAP